MTLDQYLHRILSIVSNHWIVTEIEPQEIKQTAEDLYVKLKLSTIEGSAVHLREYVVLTADTIDRKDYSYQFRYEDQAGFLRYDNAHKVHHKHASGEIVEQDATPRLIDFLREIEQIIIGELEG